ncbi:MAG: hypothetical protein LC637_04215 [Xanthomonadaceae bacterium]|nr:hypothetical protein [Xanthomonadaceae bacterium]
MSTMALEHVGFASLKRHLNAALWACVLVLAGSLPVQAEPSARMVELLFDLDRIGAQLDELWPGYRPSLRNYGVYREQRDALLRVSDPPPDGFLTLADPRHGARYVYSNQPPPGMAGPFVVNLELDDVVVTAVRAGSTLATLIHEDFHGFQRQAWGPKPKDFTPDRALATIESAEILAYLKLENALLEKAWRQRDQRQRKTLLDYLALRQARETLQGPEFTRAERWLERIEGSASWIDQQASAALGQTRRARIDAIAANFRGSEQARSPQALMRIRAYASGSTLIEMLKRWSPEPDWKKRIADGAPTLVQLLATALDAGPDELERRAEKQVRGRVFKRALAQARDAIAATRPVLETGDYRWQLVMAVREPENDPLAVTFSVTGGFDSLADDWTLLADVREFRVVSQRFKLHVSGHPVLFRKVEEGDSKWLEVALLLSEPPRTSDGRLRPGRHVLQGAPFEQSGLELTSDASFQAALRPID